MIKIITGIRRCGKSYLLFQLFKKYLLGEGIDESHIIRLALDGIENEELRNPSTCYQYIKNQMLDDETYYILLDEIQFLPRFEEVLNSLLRYPNTDIYVTSSNSRCLSTDIVTEFRGRGDEVRIYLLSFEEFFSVYDGDYEDALNDYMIYGGLPQITKFQIVYLELLSRGYNVDVGVVDVFETSAEGRRVHKQLEVDFIVNKGSNRYYIQVAYDFSSEEKRKQELNSLKNISDSI